MSICLLFVVFAAPEVRIVKGVGRKIFNTTDQSWRAEHYGYQTG